jgi:hypothetical protein
MGLLYSREMVGKLGDGWLSWEMGGLVGRWVDSREIGG